MSKVRFNNGPSDTLHSSQIVCLQSSVMGRLRKKYNWKGRLQNTSAQTAAGERHIDVQVEIQGKKSDV